MTWIGLVGIVAVLAYVFVAKRGATKSRSSIAGMLDESHPCAVRIRR